MILLKNGLLTFLGPVKIVRLGGYLAYPALPCGSVNHHGGVIRYTLQFTVLSS